MSPRCRRGFTVIEVTITVAVVVLLAAVAWPSMQAQLMRARRADAIGALTRVHVAQEQYRARFGSYSPDLTALRGPGSSRSPEGWYEIALQDGAGEVVTVAARALASGSQARDSECRQITLHLNQGMADFGPTARCWNR